MSLKISTLITFITILLLGRSAYAKRFDYSHSVMLTKIVSVNDVIWGFDFLDEGTIVFTQKRGVLALVEKDGTIKEISHSVPVNPHGQGGLLDLYVLDSKTKDILLTYSSKVSGGFTTRLSRGRLVGTSLQEHRLLFTAKAQGSTWRHFGSRLAVDTKQKHIYMSIGDRGERDKAQLLNWHNGKIVRLQYDGKAAKGNPFENKSDALGEIWSYGHRNPQGLYLDKSGTLWEAEFGPKGGDEINKILPGKNYGWPLVTHGREYSGAYIGPENKPGLEAPFTHYTPSISPSGMMRYESNYFEKWSGDLFLANLATRHLRRVKISSTKVLEEEVLFHAKLGRIRHVAYDKEGLIYFSTDDGALYRIEKAE